MQILIGRIVVIAGLIVFSLLSTIPPVAILAFLALLVAIPWLVVRSARFNARMTSWSNVRFAFHGKYGGAAKVMLVYPFLAALTAYLAFPFADRARRRWIVNNHSLGKTPFGFEAKIGGFYIAALLALVWVLALLVVGGLVLGPYMQQFFAGMEAGPPQPDDIAGQLSLMVPVYAFMFIALAPAGAIYWIRTRNIVFNNAALGVAHEFRSTAPTVQYMLIVLTNAIAVICTLGLLLPWAQIRVAKFLSAHTVMLVGGSLDGFIGDMQSEENSLGDAYSDLEGLDMDVGI
jgi:uncharacterized membrane protein YjgN (DUF898 family)